MRQLLAASPVLRLAFRDPARTAPPFMSSWRSERQLSFYGRLLTSSPHQWRKRPDDDDDAAKFPFNPRTWTLARYESPPTTKETLLKLLNRDLLLLEGWMIAWRAGMLKMAPDFALIGSLAV